MSELGTLLVRAREARGLTLQDAERDTRISRRYLQALESEQFEAIPAPVYARGFLRSYSQYLGLDPQEMLDRFPRDEADPPTYRHDVTQRASPDNPISATSASRPSWRRPQASRPARQPLDRQSPPERSSRTSLAGRSDYPDDEEIDDGAYEERGPATRRTGSRDLPRRPYDDRDDVDSRYNRRDERDQSYDDLDDVDPRRTDRDDYRTPIRRPALQRQTRQQSPREPMIGVDIGVPAPARRIRTDPAAQTRTLAVVAVAIGAIIVVIVIALLLSRAGSSAAGLPATVGATTPEGQTTTVSEPTPPATPSVVPGSPVSVPDVLNLQRSQAEAAIEKAGLEVSVLEQNATQPKGTVIDQAPAPGSSAVAGNTVHLVVSTGQ